MSNTVVEPEIAIVLRAISYAACQHQGQLRKDRITPYVAHPSRVMTILAMVFGVKDAEVLAAAVLHDTIEDTTVDRDELIQHFGERIAEYVALLSKDKRLPEQDREQRYFEGLATAPLDVKLCKLADTYDNLVDSAGLSAQQRAKAIGKAEHLIDLFGGDWPADWQHVLQSVRQQIKATAALRQ